MKIKNYGNDFCNKVTIRLSDAEKAFISDMSKKYNIKESQYLRLIIDFFMTHDIVKDADIHK